MLGLGILTTALEFVSAVNFFFMLLEFSPDLDLSLSFLYAEA